MADKVRRVEYYYVTVPDKPGEGLKVLSALKDAGVLLLACQAFPTSGGKAQLNLVPEDAGKFKKAAEAARLALTGPRRAFLITGDDRVGAAAAHAKTLADASINVTAVTALGAGSGRYGMIVWVAPADYEKATKALGASA
ncbi:MAG TPA: hypothetical protein VFJ45_08545 [bacterium]|nr:hypothetical protein [bacterium]